MKPSESKLTPKKLAALNLLSERPEVQRYFFAKASGLDLFDVLKERGFFDPQYNPAPRPSDEKGFFTVPAWPVLSYLEKIAEECGIPPNKKYAEQLIQIIRDVTRPDRVPKVDNYWTWVSFAKIMAHLPSELIRVDDVELVSDWLTTAFNTSLLLTEISDSLLPKMLKSDSPEDKQKALTLLKIVIQHLQKNVSTKSTSSMDYFTLKELLTKNAELLGGKHGKEAVELLRDILLGSLEENDDRLSYIWRPAIEDHEQNVSDRELKSILVSALRDVLLAFAQKEPESAKKPLLEFLSSDAVILKRIAIYVLNVHFRISRDLVESVLKPEFFEPEFRHEMFHLLKEHFPSLTAEVQKTVLEIISGINVETDQPEKEKWEKGRRLNWLKALQEKSPDAAKLYEQYSKELGYEPEHPDFPSYMESGSWGNVSPCSASELLAKDIPAVIQYLNDFRESAGFKNPTEAGLADSLREALKAEPSRFEGFLSAFLGTKLCYQYSIISGFRELWKARQPINWKMVLEFSYAVVKAPEFWKSAEKSFKAMEPTPQWIVGGIGELIEIGVQNDEWAFEAELLPTAREIIDFLLRNQPSTSDIDPNDALTGALNSPRGKVLGALFNLALRQCRLADKSGAGHINAWIEIEPLMNRELDACKDSNLEFSAIVGAHLPNYYYLSKDWLTRNIAKIFPLNFERSWTAAFSGYCYVNTIYQEIYRLLKEAGVFKKALEANLVREYFKEKLIQNIAIAYLYGFEKIDGEGSLFREILQRWRHDEISEVIQTFWSQRTNKAPPQIKEGVLGFWEWASNYLKGREKENKKVLSDLNLLAAFLDDLSGKAKEWLIQSTPFVEENFHTPFLIEDLDRLADNAPNVVADVYLAMLEKTRPTHEKVHIKSIVSKLYSAGIKDKANRICNSYETEFLRDIYDQHNK